MQGLRRDLEFANSRSGGKAPQEDLRTGKCEAGSSVNLSNLISGFVFPKQPPCFMSIACIMHFMTGTHHTSIT